MALEGNIAGMWDTGFCDVVICKMLFLTRLQNVSGVKLNLRNLIQSVIMMV